MQDDIKPKFTLTPDHHPLFSMPGGVGNRIGLMYNRDEDCYYEYMPEKEDWWATSFANVALVLKMAGLSETKYGPFANLTEMESALRLIIEDSIGREE